MTSRVQRLAMGLVCCAGWVTGAWLIVARDVGSHGATSPAGLSALLLFVAVPVATFYPLARRWHAPLYEVEAAVGWGGFATVVAFVRPADPPPAWQVVMVLVPLTVALATIFSALFFKAATRVRGHAGSFVDARRRGYMAALCLVALAMLAGLGVLAAPMIFLLPAICVLAESLIMAGRRGDVRSSPGS